MFSWPRIWANSQCHFHCLRGTSWRKYAGTSGDGAARRSMPSIFDKAIEHLPQSSHHVHRQILGPWSSAVGFQDMPSEPSLREEATALNELCFLFPVDRLQNQFSRSSSHRAFQDSLGPKPWLRCTEACGRLPRPEGRHGVRPPAAIAALHLVQAPWEPTVDDEVP